ncbi:MAG: hypothetical protein AAB289_05300 [Chloroflexota bacterium]
MNDPIHYTTIEGPKGKAEVFMVPQHSEDFWDLDPDESARTGDTQWEVRFKGTVQLAGVAYGVDPNPRVAGPRRGVSFSFFPRSKG